MDLAEEFGGGQTLDFNEAIKRRDTQVEELKKIFQNVETYFRAKEAYAKDKTLPYPGDRSETRGAGPVYAR